MKFWEISQNNSGGSFDVDSKVCHRMIIEAETGEQATRIAEDLGCYWDGVENGMDCECCGDRWYGVSEVDLEQANKKWGGYEISEWLQANETRQDAVESLKSQYPGSTWLTEPKLETKYSSHRVIGKIRLDNIEQYAQVMANLYGWTTPDIRIFYANGAVKEIFSNKIKK